MANVYVRFDDSLRLLVDAVAAELGDEGVAAGIALRDISGRLCFFSAKALAPETTQRLTSQLHAVLGPYARADRILFTPTDPGYAAIWSEPSTIRCRVGGRTIRLVDRRLTGADWLRSPADVAPGPPRFVFMSLKGGVGRSTALSVVAAHLASRGGRVLAVDLDLEAPGLGPFLLNDETVPEFGALDFLVENNFGELDDTFYADLLGPSGLAPQGGRIDVLPAFGKRSLNHPEDVLAKLGRAYAENIRPDGTIATVLDQIRALIDHFADTKRYDAVLVDARAGLHETTAASVLGLGADVLLFGRNERQTFDGYAALLAHLARFVPPGQQLPEWVDRLTPVHAKAPTSAEQRLAFDQRWQLLVYRHGPLSLSIPGATKRDVPIPKSFRDVTWDEGIADEDVVPQDWSLLQPLSVLHDDRYEGFDPLQRRDLLAEQIYRSTFGELVERVEQAVFPKMEEPP
jgi:hypothetical protein